ASMPSCVSSASCSSRSPSAAWKSSAEFCVPAEWSSCRCGRAPNRVPLYDVVADALSREYRAERDALYRPAALADAERLHALLPRAGFADVSVTPERRSLAFDTFED